MRYGHRITHILAGGLVSWMLVVSGGSASAAPVAAPLSISNTPLFLSTGAEPNVMLMVDNSFSMFHIVPELPAVAIVFACPLASQVAAGTVVRLDVNNSGLPRIDLDAAGGTAYQLGSGGGQVCFDPTASYPAFLNETLLNGDPRTATAYSGEYLNWYFNVATDPVGCANTWTTAANGPRKPCSRTRMMIARTAGSDLVDIMPGGLRVGLSKYETTFPDSGGGVLIEPVATLNAAKRTSLKTAIGAMVPETSTPLAETLSDIGFYFSQGATNLVLHPGGTPTTLARANVFTNGYTRHTSWDDYANPIQYSCQKSFAVLLTDGRPNYDRSIDSDVRDYKGECAGGLCDAAPTATDLPSGPLPNISYDNGTHAGRSYEFRGSDYLDDVAKTLEDIDLRPDLVSAQGIKNNLVSYFIGFADPTVSNDPLLLAAGAAGDGGYYPAGNEDELEAAFAAAFDSIARRTSSASAVATNSTRLDTNTLVFQAKFRSDDWTGQIIGYDLQLNGTLGAEQWNQADVIPAPVNRKIFTKNSTGTVVPFLWTNALNPTQVIDATQKAALDIGPAGTDDDKGELRLNWVRGDHTMEQQNTPNTIPATPLYPFRNRSTELGDIVNSDPQFVGASNFGYTALPSGTAGQSTYQAFRQSKLIDPESDGIFSVAKPMIYVGANDGMLHGFDAITGVERFAYIPSTLVDDLPALTNPNYAHRYFVDGQSFIGDAYINSGSGAAWHTVLVGTTGAGDKTVFALNVTDPHNFTAANVLWEFTDADLGHVIGQPAVARMADGTWVAIFGNGYNSTNHHAVLYIVNLQTGALLKKIDTGVGSAAAANGLGTPSLLPDSTRTIRAIYAGDLHGNMWKFDVSDPAPANWVVAFSGSPLFVVRDASNVTQPITAPAEIGRHPNGGYMIYFGTGQFFATGDNIVTGTTQVQSFYGLWDKTGAGAISPSTDRSALQAQTILAEVTPTGSNFLTRVTSNTTPNWSTKRGWYIDLNSPVIAGPEGERVVSLPVLRNNKIIFPTLVPSSVPCEFGGTSWLMEMDAVTGSRLTQPPLDINENGQIDSGDNYTGTIGGTPGPWVVSGIRSGEGIIDTPAVVEIPGEDEEIKIASGTSGGVETIRERGETGQARGSWRQLR